MSARPRLPARVQVFERGWLSANNVLLFDGDLLASVWTPGALAVARARQENKAGWVEKNRAKKRD